MEWQIIDYVCGFRTGLQDAEKKGVVCYECESGNIVWNNKKIKRIHKLRFNNFDFDIIQVISNKLEITYLDKHTGEILEEEKIGQVRQVLNWMRCSLNGRYLIGADTVSVRDKAIYTVYDIETKMVKGPRRHTSAAYRGDSAHFYQRGAYAPGAAHRPPHRRGGGKLCEKRR